MFALLSIPAEVQKEVKEGKISPSHARTLSKIEDPSKISELADKIINEKLNVRELEQQAKEEPKKVKQNRNNSFKSREYELLEQDLENYLGTKVRIKNKKLEINYTNEQDLNRILEIINFNK
jgi:ParB family chromosome partitioning protein